MPPPPAGHNPLKPNGFTLVEIAIVMVVIGLLIGGVFGGMRLIDISTANGIASQIKSIESSTLTFKSIYGRLPGDLRNPNTRLPNCNTAPCSVSGNGNNIVGTMYTGAPTGPIWSAYSNTSENYTFWHHLQASDLVSLGITNSNDMSFGVGTPESSESGVGFRVSSYNSPPLINMISMTEQCSSDLREGLILSIESDPNGGTGSGTLPCSIASMVDKKIDDGMGR